MSQTVLLKGVNDSVDVLTELMRRLVALKVKPYYLHHPDRARGTAKFRLTLAEGQALVSALRGNISGLCQPTYMIDIPGGHGKVPIQPPMATSHYDSWHITDYRGHKHRYDDP